MKMRLRILAHTTKIIPVVMKYKAFTFAWATTTTGIPMKDTFKMRAIAVKM
jgi:hypothetical protein